MDDSVIDKVQQIRRRWGKQNNPTRKLVLWGWDKKMNPSFAILFGPHEIDSGSRITITQEDIEKYHDSLKEELKPEISPGEYNLLSEDVNYVGYTILQGNHEHLPPFLDLKLLTPSHYDYSTRSRVKGRSYLVNRKGLYKQYKSQRHGYYREIQLKEAASFINLSPENQFFLPYFKELSYRDKVNKIRGDVFNGEFKVAKDPNEILKLSKTDEVFLDLIVELMSNQSLYNRKKFLRNLVEKKPPKSIYEKIVEIGGEGVVSGLFLELAKIKNPILKEEASKIVNFTFRWSEPKFAEGVKRCAQIYLNSIDSTLKENRIKEITNIVAKIDLIPVHGNKPRGRAGRYLEKREKNTSYNDYVKKWGDQEWGAIGPTLKFSPSHISDGFRLNHIMFKNLIQEAEVYKAPDLLGTLAYYIDTPKFYYFMLASGYQGFYNYIHRYVRRTLDSLARGDEHLFILAVKTFFSNYKPYDLVSGRQIPDSINEILRYYTTAPRIRSRSRHYSYYRDTPRIDSIDFKSIRAADTYQKKLELWNKYFTDVLEIATESEVHYVLDFCFNLINARSDLDNILGKLPPKLMVELSLSKHVRLRNLFREKLTNLLTKADTFDHNLMFALMECSDNTLHEQAWAYFDRTKGKITPEMVVDLLLLNNVENWFEFIIERIRELKGIDYFKFVEALIAKIYSFFKKQVELPEEILDQLNKSTNKVNEIPQNERAKLLNLIIDLLIHESTLPEWTSDYLQNLIFSVAYDDLLMIIKEIEIDFSAKIPSMVILYMLRALSTKLLPSDSEILEILEIGPPEMVRTLIEMVRRNTHQVKERYTTLQLMFESEIATLNEIAINVFEGLPKEAFNRTLSILIDSPEKKVITYALNKLDEIYGEKLPKNIIIQMLEHASHDIKSYISEKIDRILDDLGNGNSEIFLYYIKTLIFLPNLKSKSKDKIYQLIPEFVFRNKENCDIIEEILLEIGGSNIIKDSERALVALAKIKMEVI